MRWQFFHLLLGLANIFILLACLTVGTPSFDEKIFSVAKDFLASEVIVLIFFFMSPPDKHDV